jgi:hypothetical protein
MTGAENEQNQQGTEDGFPDGFHSFISFSNRYQDFSLPAAMSDSLPVSRR